MQVVVVGGGAAGVFAAIQCKLHHPNVHVILVEKSNELLQKVKISGGGRCNVTHASDSIAYMHRCYPRGGKQLKKLFGQFFTKETVNFFESRGVKLKAEEDHRMFPVTDNSQTIIDCLVRELHKGRVEVKFNTTVNSITQTNRDYALDTSSGEMHADRLILATGGSPNERGLGWLKDIGYAIAAPVPSLFTFNLKKHAINALMGVSVNPVSVKIQGFEEVSEGPLLITHWGFSGPAVLKLSAFAARFLHEQRYQYSIGINWLGNQPEHELREAWNARFAKHAKQKVGSKNPFDLPARLWDYLLKRAEVDGALTWSTLPKKQKNRLIHVLTNDTYDCKGKTTFKEEFVTAGGVAWENIHVKTMESKLHAGLFFAGELVDMDGITGGFNFQAAWTTGFVAGNNAGITK